MPGYCLLGWGGFQFDQDQIHSVVADFAIYLVPMNVWYILPFEALAGTVSLQFAPEREGHKYQSLHGGLAFAEGACQGLGSRYRSTPYR